MRHITLNGLNYQVLDESNPVMLLQRDGQKLFYDPRTADPEQPVTQVADHVTSAIGALFYVVYLRTKERS